MEDFKESMLKRYLLLYISVFVLLLLVIVGLVRLQFVEGHEWRSALKENIPTEVAQAPRGNIYSADGQLMASSMPLYRVFMDTYTDAQKQKDGKLMYDNIDSLASGLHLLFGEKSKEEYKQLILHNFEQHGRGCHHVPLCKRNINYVELQQLQHLPILERKPIQGGLIVERVYRRTHPYGSLASRTIGTIYAVEQKEGSDEISGGTGRKGLERAFENYLKGKDGINRIVTVNGKRFPEVVKEAIPGKDIITTIDVQMQDIAEKSLRAELDEVKGDWGCAVLMETKTGHIKAIVNLGMDTKDSTYSENDNYVFGRALEPGSTFKPIALMASLDEGYSKLTDVVDNEEKRTWTFQEGERPIRDEGAKGRLTLKDVIACSSNIGISKVTLKNWNSRRADFVEKLREMGIVDSVNCDILGVAKPRISVPQSMSDLARMSFGYTVELPVIYSLMWYNAVANNGRMMRPMLVTEIRENGQPIKHFNPEVVREQICQPGTLADIRSALEAVVWDDRYATAKTVQSPFIRIAGKTGTAQLLEGGRYERDERHRVSFCGYFPAEAPEYTCICVIHNPRHGKHSGGRMGGRVVRDIAERVMATRATHVDENDNDSIPLFPTIKHGYAQPMLQLCHQMGIPVSGQPQHPEGLAHTTGSEKGVCYQKDPLNKRDIVPDVRGMGAKDAIYLMERSGLRVRLKGVGRVVEQSLLPGTKATKDREVWLTLR